MGLVAARAHLGKGARRRGLLSDGNDVHQLQSSGMSTLFLQRGPGRPREAPLEPPGRPLQPRCQAAQHSPDHRKVGVEPEPSQRRRTRVVLLCGTATWPRCRPRRAPCCRGGRLHRSPLPRPRPRPRLPRGSRRRRPRLLAASAAGQRGGGEDRRGWGLDCPVQLKVPGHLGSNVCLRGRRARLRSAERAPSRSQRPGRTATHTLKRRPAVAQRCTARRHQKWSPAPPSKT